MNLQNVWNAMAEIREMHAIIHGHVQGVGFRASTKRYAEQLQIVGSAKNCPDLTVEIYAQGGHEDLERLLEQLKKNFSITSVDVNYHMTLHSYQGFRII